MESLLVAFSLVLCMLELFAQMKILNLSLLQFSFKELCLTFTLQFGLVKPLGKLVALLPETPGFFS